MAASRDQPNVVDVMSCDTIGEMQLDIQSIFNHNVAISQMQPIRFCVFYKNGELSLQIKLKHSTVTDMIEANLEVLGGATNNLRFKIKYGFKPFLPYRSHAQIFIYTPTNKRSDDYRICKLEDLAEHIACNEVALKYEPIKFISTITISLRDTRALISQYQIPTVNANDCDHTLICEGHSIKTHKYILMGASQWFLRRFTENPLFDVTIIDQLEEQEQRIERDVLICLLRFMYGQNISEHNLRTTNLLSAARVFEVNKLFEICEESLIKELSPGMAPELFYIGRTEAAFNLAFQAAKYISYNYKAVKERYEWDAIMRLFPKFFADIKPNPLKYFRGILFPPSRSDGELIVQTGVSFLLRQPEIVITRPMPEVPKGETKSKKIKGETETTSTDERRSSEDATLFECPSLVEDVTPRPRKRSSPVLSCRRRSDSSSPLGALRRSDLSTSLGALRRSDLSSSLGALRRSDTSSSSSSSLDAYRMKSLQDVAPRIKFSRESLKQKLLANEPSFDDDFGPVETIPGPIRALHRSTSLPVDNTFRLRDRSDQEYKSTVRAHSDQEYKMRFHRPRFDIPMDCREDSKLGESKDPTEDSSNSPRSMGTGTLSGERPDLSSPSLKSMRSLEWGLTYSYSSDSVFERESPKSMSKVPTPPQDMSVSEISSRFHDIAVSPKLMKRIDFGMYTHPEARSLSDISSIPMDPSTSHEPDSSSSSKTRKRREKRLKKSSDNKRKLAPGVTPFDFSSTDTGSTGIIPRPTFSKEKSPGKRHFPSQFHQKKGIRKISPLGSSETTSPESMSSKKVTFGETDYIQTYVEDVEFNEPEMKEQRYYENWLDTASLYNIQDFFDEEPSSNVEDVEEKSWDEKDEEELTAPLLRKINEQLDRQLQIASSSSSSATAAQELPIGGGVIRKAPGRFRSSVDDPAPLSTSESVGTTSSSITSSEYKKSITEMLADLYSTVEKKPKQKKRESDTSSNLVRTESYSDLRLVYAPPTDMHQRRTTPTLAGVYSIGLPEGNIQQPMQGPNISGVDTKEDDQNVKSETSGVADVKPKIEKDPQ